MKGTNAYLEQAFEEDRDELSRIRVLVAQTAHDFDRLLVDGQWPYEVIQGGVLAAPGKYSQSTNAMILFALAAAAGLARRGCSLTVDVQLREPVDFGEKWELFKTAWSKLLKETSEHGSLMISAGPP